jgi:hypothetical protein
MKEVNHLLVEQYKLDREAGAVALAFVPAGSRPNKVIDAQTNELESMQLKQAYTGSFMIRCAGGVIIANRIGNEIEVGSVIPIEAGGKKKTKAQLIDDINLAHAAQGARLAGVPVSFESELNSGEVITVDLRKAA